MRNSEGDAGFARGTQAALANYQESRIRHLHRTLDLYLSGTGGAVK